MNYSSRGSVSHINSIWSKFPDFTAESGELFASATNSFLKRAAEHIKQLQTLQQASDDGSTNRFKGELTWKIHLYILLPKCVYLFIQCTKNMF